MMRELRLMEFENRLAGTLSGGNKVGVDGVDIIAGQNKD